ncbi:MAG TPA: PAS domain S-box protein [Acidobacteriaceae bacterium]|nr:PAS domain S-box protein [Acidobacteriaceae bacterium]
MPPHERSGEGDPGASPIPQLAPPGAAPLGFAAAETPAQSLFEHAPCGLAALGTNGCFLSANAALLQIIGKSASSLQNICFQDLLTAGGRLFYETQFTPTLLLRERITEISFDLPGPDGTRVPAFVNACLYTDPGSGQKLILLAVFPAEQRRLYERELLRARKEFEQIAEVVRRSSDAILRLDPDAVIRTWNDGAEQIFGFSAAEAVGKPLTTLFAPGSEVPLTSAIADLRRGLEGAMEMIGIDRSGKRLDLSVNLTPHLEPPGILVSFSAILRDITSRKLAERALLQNEKLASVGRLASSIAHEINNPLESVTNLLYILESRVDAETRDLVMTAQEELARVSHIATHTLRFHKQSTRRTEVDLHGLTASVLSLYRARFEASDIRVLTGSADVSRLLCFEGELRQILVNLVSNAFDAMRTGGRLYIRHRDVMCWSQSTRSIRITVADTGSGMDEETLARLYEPFFSTKGIGGTGLGLWITEDLVRKNGGRIRIRSSNRPGRSGTVAMLSFRTQTDQKGPGTTPLEEARQDAR